MSSEKFLQTDTLFDSNRKAETLQKAEIAIKLQRQIFDYAYALKQKYPEMGDARIRRKTEEYFKRSIKNLDQP